MKIIAWICGLLVAVVFLLLFGSSADTAAIAALPMNAKYDVKITGGKRQPDGSVVPYYSVHTGFSLFQKHGGTVVDVGDLRIIYPDDGSPYWRETEEGVATTVAIEMNSELAGGGGNRGSGGLRISAWEEDGAYLCEAELNGQAGRKPDWSLEFLVRGRELTLLNQTFEIGLGYRVIYLDLENRIERIEQIDHKRANIDMSKVTEFGGTWEALREHRRGRGGF